MSVGFRAVQWNRKKLVYDGILLAAVALYIAGFAAIYWRLASAEKFAGRRSTSGFAPLALARSSC